MSNPRYARCDRRQQRRRWAIQALPCYICGRPIDYDRRAPDPLSFVIDETIPLKHGGTLTYDNQGPAHWWCNRVKSTHSLAWAKRKVAELIANGDSPFTQPRHEPKVTSSTWFS